MTWYRTGTVSLTNGSGAVVGAGTAWLGAKVEAGDSMTLPDGRDYEIQAVGADTSITLATPYLGASVAGAVYQIKPIATIARLSYLSAQISELVLTYADIAKTAGLGKFAKGTLVDNIMRPALRGLADDDTGINFPGNNVIEQWQGGVKTASVAADGTPSGLMWNQAPISAAAAAALDGKVGKAFRTMPGGWNNSAGDATWRSIGVIAVEASAPARITLFGTGGYVDLDACSGATEIYLRGTNGSVGRGIEGHFFGISKGNGTITAVALKRLEGNSWRVYVKVGQYMAFSASCDVSGSFVPESVDTGSADQPAASRLLESLNWWMVGGLAAMGLSSKGLDVPLGGIKQGPLARPTAKKLLTGNVATTAGQTAQIALGMSADLIVGVNVLVRYDDSGSCIGPNADGPTLPASYYRFRVWMGPSVLNVHVDNGEGSALLGRPFRAWIEYIVE